MKSCSVYFRQYFVSSFVAFLGTFGVSAVAQPALTPDNPVLPPQSVARALTPSNPALAGPAVPTPAPASTNFSIAGLSQLLAGLQAQMQQVLPVLNAFNNSFDFISIGSLTNTGGFTGTGANLSSSSSANLSSQTGANLGTTIAVPTLNTGSGSSLNAFGLPPGLGVAPVTSETLRSLLVLESDLEHILPTLNALNGVTNAANGIGLTPGFVPGAVSNVFMVPSTLR